MVDDDDDKNVNLDDVSLAKLGLNRLDKLLDAKVVRGFFKSTKKDFALFISENDEVKDFLTSLEEKIVEADDEYKQMIQEYMESISDDINKFKTHLKELQRKKKLQVAEIQKKLIREEILREMEAEKKKQEIIDKLGIKKTEKESINEETIETITPTVSQLKFKKSSTSKKIESSNKDDKPSDDQNKQIINEIIKNVNDDEKYQKSLDLGEFYAFLKEVIKNDLLIIKNDTGRMKIRDIDLDNNIIRIKVD